jgi:hypothetical protein
MPTWINGKPGSTEEKLLMVDRRHGAKPAFLSFPVAVAVAICSRVIDWRRGSE